MQWLPAFIERSFNVPRSQIGASLALTQGLTSFAGGIIGGLIADRLARHTALGPLRMAMLAITAALIPMTALYLAGSVNRVYPLLALMTFLFSMPAGALFSLLQTVVNPARRATAAALAAMVASFIGVGLGPLLVGVLSDQLSTVHGSDSLRIAMFATGALVGPWTLFHLWRLHVALSMNSS
jgi:MFS family permease